MSGVLVDSNVLLDIFTNDPVWAARSERAILSHAAGSLVINPIVFAEVSIRFERIEELEALLPAGHFVREPLPFSAGFLAGKAYMEYRRRGGRRDRILPDFYIGAHAAVAGHRLLTRDAARYRGYFPTVKVVEP